VPPPADVGVTEVEAPRLPREDDRVQRAPGRERAVEPVADPAPGTSAMSASAVSRSTPLCRTTDSIFR
jgi:hypothetical protein